MANAKLTQIRLATRKSRRTGPTETSPWLVCLGQVRQHLVWLLLVFEGLKTIVPAAGIASWYDHFNSQGSPLDTGASNDLSWLSVYTSGRILDKEDWTRSRITMQPISPSSMSSNTRMVIITTKNMPNATTRSMQPIWKRPLSLSKGSMMTMSNPNILNSC